MAELEKSKKHLRNYVELLIKHASYIQKIALHLSTEHLQPFIRIISEFGITPCTRKYIEINNRFLAMMQECGTEIIALCNKQIDSATRVRYSENVAKIHQIALESCYCVRHINNIAMEKNIVSRVDSEYFNGFIGDKKCTMNAIYVETRVIEKLQKLCENSSSCGIQESIQFCNLLAEFKNMKQKVEFSYLNNDTNVNLLRLYREVYNSFQERYIKLMFKNIIVLFNENVIQCMITFLDQQIQIIIQNNHKISEIERIENFKRPAAIEWRV